VFVSSAVALVAAPGLAVYAATKAAMHSLSRSLRRELTSGSSQREPASGSIRVFEVLPPWVDTDLARSLRVAKIPPEDVADAVVRGLARDRYQIAVGQIRALLLISRLAPRMADALFARATREVGAGSPRSCGLTGARIERERRGSDVEEDGGAPIHQRSGRAQLG